MLQSAVSVLACLMPAPLKRRLLRACFGWRIHPTARIGLSLFTGVRELHLGAGARIGHFNVFRNLRSLELGESSIVGQWNWMTASPLFQTAARDVGGGRLRLGAHSSITSRHYLDCAGGLEIGDFVVMAGVRSTIFTHEIDTATSRQTPRPVRIGSYCYIGSDVRITPGSRIPDRCLIAMGSVVSGDLQEADVLYGGVPARRLKAVDGAFFSRAEGYVWP